MANNNITKIDTHERLKEAYMSYSIATIVDRSIPDVRDGLLPVYRRVLYAMYNKGLTYNKPRAKSSEPVSETLKIHNHGDASAYGSYSLLTEQNESLLHPFIDGEGSFGKKYSTDPPSHMRYTFGRLNKFSEEMFMDLNKNAVKFYGDEHRQPVVLPNTFPNILVKPNKAVAVGEACNFGSFNLNEVCNTTIDFINNKDINLLEYLTPDFSTGAYLIYDKDKLNTIYNTGKGSIILRSKYKYDKENHILEFYEIPYSTTVETIISEIESKSQTTLKEVIDVRDESGFNKQLKKEELIIAIDLKKSANVDLVVKKLYKETSLEDSFSFNMNCLVNNSPKVLGIKSILNHWIDFRHECIRNTMQYDIDNKEIKLHLLLGLKRVLLNIDKAIDIIRNSEENEMINKLMLTFSVDEKQAIFISEIKLKNINKNYITKQISDIDNLEQEVLLLKDNVNSTEYINNIIISQLENVKKKFGKPRKTEIIMPEEIEDISKEDLIENFNCKLLYTKDGYLKKLLKSNDTQKLKDGDEIIEELPSTNKSTIFIITNKANRYKINCYELDENKPSTLGTYMYSLFDFEPDEKIIKVVSIEDENKGYIVATYENGNVSKVKIKAYISNNTKLLNCYGNANKLLSIDYITKDCDVLLVSKEGKALIVNTSDFNPKQNRSVSGDIGIKLLKESTEDNKVVKAFINIPGDLNFKITTENGKSKEFYLDDVAPTGKLDENRSTYDYIKGKRNNQGKFLINTRSTTDTVKNVEIL